MNRPIIIDTVAGQAADIRRQHDASSAAFVSEHEAAVTFLQQLLTAVAPAYPALESRVAANMPDAVPVMRGVALHGSDEPVLVGFDSPSRNKGDVGGSCLVWVREQDAEDALVGLVFGGSWRRSGGRTDVSVNAKVNHLATGTAAIAAELSRKSMQVTQRLTELVDRVHQGNAQARAEQALALTAQLRAASVALRTQDGDHLTRLLSEMDDCARLLQPDEVHDLANDLRVALGLR